MLANLRPEVHDLKSSILLFHIQSHSLDHDPQRKLTLERQTRKAQDAEAFL